MISHNWSPMKRLIWLRGSGITGGSGTWDTISGNPVSFTARNAPLRKLEVAFSPVQDLHGYDSPWPAGGGKNIFNYAAVPNENQYISAFDGNPATPGTGTFRHSDYIPVIGGATYYFGYTPYAANAAGCAFYTSEKVFISGQSGNGLIASSMRYTLPDSTAYVRFSWRIDEGYDTNWENTVYFGLASDPHEYSPYSNECPISGWSSLTVYHSGADTSNPQTISISLGSTVYSGWVDVVTGVGNDSGSKISFSPDRISTWFDEDAARDTLGFYMQAVHFNERYPAPKNNQALFEQYKRQSAYSNDIPWAANFIFVSGSFIRFEARVPKSVLAPFSTYAESQAAVLAYLAEHPIVMWYEKAEPTPISLTPQEVQSLAGDNTMWTDGDSLTVEYRSN